MKNATAPRDKNKTKQDYGTDKKFLKALNKRYPLAWDLACTKENCVVANTKDEPLGYFHPEVNSLEQFWYVQPGWLFLNPPFANIRPWAEKCYKESLKGANIIFLTPASVGSTWYRDFVFRKAHTFFLQSRLTFEGTKPNPKTGKFDPYPKDCMISVFDNFHHGLDLWDWRAK